MAELILPGVYIEVRPEGLIVPGQISVGNLGVVGTASKGEIGRAVLVSSYADAIQRFGTYDSFLDPSDPTKPRTDSLTLVRALEQAFAFGATTVFAVRVAGSSKATASFKISSATGDNTTLTAKTPGTWANNVFVNIGDAEEDGFIEDENVPTSGTGALTLKRTKVVKSARNRVTLVVDATGVTTVFSAPNILYGGGLPDDDAEAVTAGKIKVDRATGAIAFDAGELPVAADKLKATYVVERAKAVKVTLRLGQTDEVYTVVDGKDLVADINASSVWVTAKEETNAGELPNKSAPLDAFAPLKGGADGQSGADYKAGLELLLNEDSHIIVAAGQDDRISSDLDKHCQKASTDVIKRDRIGVVGSKPQDPKNPDAFFDYLRSHNISSDRLIFVAPGIKATDAAATPPATVTLPGAYAAAAFAGFLSSLSAHISPTNKVLPVDGLERDFTSPELTQLVQRGILLLEKRQGFRIVRGITTQPPGSAFAQITTRRIVDFAKFGVRSAATSYIGLLNNERVRGALKATVNSFLAEMVIDEQLVSYDLTVSATREEERKGIARVTMTLRPTFSIDFIKVTMFLD
jgi:hypothetical protein